MTLRLARYRGGVAVALLLVGHAARPAERDAALVSDALAQRAAVASSLICTLGLLSYGTPVAAGEGQWPVELRTAVSMYCLDTPALQQRTLHQAQAAGRGQWHEMLSFIWQDVRSREESELTLQPPDPGIVVRRTAPRADDSIHLPYLGLARPDGESLLSLLHGDMRVGEPRQLGGTECLVVEADDGELWVAPALDYAPVRLIRFRGAARDTMHINDWCAYRASGDMLLPEFAIVRTYRVGEGTELRDLVIARFDVAVAGDEPVDAARPGDWHVPYLPGAAVALPAGGFAQFGFSPYQLWLVGAGGCEAWGLSVADLCSDPNLRPPAAEAAP